MTPRQFGIVTLLFGASLIAASFARPGTWETAIGSRQVEPGKATVAALADVPAEDQQPPIRVILPSPYEGR
jgi:hypothetical protein